jgi:hypothetical protein
MLKQSRFILSLIIIAALLIGICIPFASSTATAGEEELPPYDQNNVLCPHKGYHSLS